MHVVFVIHNNNDFTACMNALEGVKFDEDPLLPSVKYRRSLIKSLFYKVILYTTIPYS